MLISQALSPTALRNGSKTAFRYLKHNITYKEFWETANRYSYYLQKEWGHGLRVGLWMSSCPHIAYSFIALANTKSCTVPLNPWASPEENLFKIKNAGITHMLTTTDQTKNLREFLAQNGHGSIKIIEIEGKRCAEYDTTYSPPSSHPPLEPDHILLFYTPGTTGKYKGCLFDHKSVTQALTAVKGAYKTLPTDVFYTQHLYTDPFNFIHFLLSPLLAGATVYISDQVDPKEILGALTEFRVTRMAPKLGPLEELLKTSEAEKLPIPTVKHFVFQRTKLEPTVFDLVKKHTKAGILQTYGMTEYLGTVAMGTPDAVADATKPAGFCGPALVGTRIRVVDDNNDEIDKKKQQRGQLTVTGPLLMAKYLDLPEDQKQTVRGTWLYTGDVVDIDSAGNVVFLDRKADVVVLQSGVKVFAKDVEVLVKALPQIEECAYVGIRDRLKKPHPALVAVKKPQAVINEKQVHDHLATRLSGEKLPVHIFFIDAMPRTVAGSINRAKLRSMYDGI